MSTEMKIRPEEEEARILVARATVLENEAKAIVITDTASYESAAAFKQAIRAKRDEVMGGDKGPLSNKAKAHGVWKFLSDICNMVQAPFDKSEEIVDQKMIAYRGQVERKRAEEARKDREKSEAKARKEREAEIARAKERGDREAAKNLKAAPLEVKVTAPKTPEPPKIKGMPTRKIWKYQIDVNALDRKYMIPDEATIGKIVRALGAAHGITGVTAYQEDVQ